MMRNLEHLLVSKCKEVLKKLYKDDSASKAHANCTIKEAECQRIDAFELWCWIRLFRVPWTARRSNQSILKEISPEYSLKGLMLKLQYFDHLMEDWTHWKRLMLGKFEGKRRRGW